MMTEPTVNVAFLPVYPNPYQSQLADALSNHGVQVQMLSKMPGKNWLEQNKGQVQILHLHWLYGIYMARFQTPFRVVAFLRWLSVAQQLGYHVVWTAHNIMPHRTELRPLHRAIRSRIMEEADAVIVHCHYGEVELRRRFERQKPIHVIPIGNQIGRFPITLSAGEARASLGLRPDQFIYLFLGLLAPYKGLEELTLAFSRVAAADDLLLIAGASLSAHVTRQLRTAAQADPRIRLYLTHIADDEMQQYLLSADVLVAPYRAVLTSSSAVLGLSYGLPVIAPALGCMPRLVPSEAGILYDPARPNGLANALTVIKSRKPEAMRTAALATAEQLDWDSIGRQTAAVYRACLESAA